VVIADRSSTIAAFLSGQISWIEGIQPQEEAQIRAGAKDALRYTSMFYVNTQLQWNVTLPQFKDPRVRKAIQLAIDYKALADPLGKWTNCAITQAAYPEAWKPDEVAKLPGYNQATKA